MNGSPNLDTVAAILSRVERRVDGIDRKIDKLPEHFVDQRSHDEAIDSLEGQLSRLRRFGYAITSGALTILASGAGLALFHH